MSFFTLISSMFVLLIFICFIYSIILEWRKRF
uniref:Uncharacterized protein n=1 Tax=Ackermannviridae sp. ctUml7 TaxID=2825753 RepID=A0A8S5V9Z8_9CAUD|nr:MAG TPA: hypothetical protein [Ackermannviridae sp. ctUml7]